MTVKYLNNYVSMKHRNRYKAGKKTLIALSIAGISVGLAIMITVIAGYLALSLNGFYYNGVKLGGSLLSHQEIYDEIIIFVSALLSASSLFLLIKLILEKKVRK